MHWTVLRAYMHMRERIFTTDMARVCRDLQRYLLNFPRTQTSLNSLSRMRGLGMEENRATNYITVTMTTGLHDQT